MTRRLVVLVVLLALAIALPLAGWLAAPALAPALRDLPVPVLFPVSTCPRPRRYGATVPSSYRPILPA